MANKIVVLGSLNLDSILHVTRLPLPGETLEMSDKSSAPGGKGAIRLLRHLEQEPRHRLLVR